MAWRGGGRGGRGRGSFGSGAGPVARDDDGLILAPDKPDGPPKLFPPVESLPELPDLGPKDLQLLGYRRHFEQAMLGSPYHVEKPTKRLGGVEADIARYSDRYKKAKAVTRAPLSSVLKLTLAHFPGELLDTSARPKTAQSSGLTPWKLQKTAGNDLQRLDQLANMEEKTEGKEGKEGEEKKKEEGDDDDEEVVEDEEEEFGENDYGETYGFEDDEEYAEMDDGDDEGPTF